MELEHFVYDKYPSLKKASKHGEVFDQRLLAAVMACEGMAHPELKGAEAYKPKQPTKRRGRMTVPHPNSTVHHLTAMRRVREMDGRS